MIWLCACAEPEPVGTIALRWAPGYADETWEQARAGLAWALSLMGGVPPSDGSWIEEREDGVVRVDLARAAIDPGALAVEDADDLRLFGALDMGRWLMATLYQPAVYYRVTGACRTRAEWEDRHPRDAVFVATASAVVDGMRRIDLHEDPARASDVAFVAVTVDAAATDIDATPDAQAETVDFLPSGQQRFAIYGADGGLMPASSDPAVGPPGRCMWCHEGGLQPLFVGVEQVDGALSPEAFEAQLARAEATLAAQRAALDSEVPFDNPLAHEWAEKLVQGFLSPPPARVAAEWGVDEEEVRTWLGEPTLPDHEYGDPLLRYDRGAVDAALRHRLAAIGESWTPPDIPASARVMDPGRVEWDVSGIWCE